MGTDGVNTLPSKKLIIRSRFQALKTIYNAIKRVHNIKNGPSCYGIGRLNPSEDEDPFAMSLGAWFRINFANTRYLHHLYDPFYNGMFREVSASRTPQRVEPYQYILSKNHLYKLPDTAAQHLYVNDLLHSFSLLYEYISSVTKDAHELGEDKILFQKAESINKVGQCNLPGSNCLTTFKDGVFTLKIPFSYLPENFSIKRYKYMDTMKSIRFSSTSRYGLNASQIQGLCEYRTYELLPY